MFYDKFNPQDMTLKEFKHWIVVLRQKQQTLGDAVIILKEEHHLIGESTSEEFAEFPQVVSWYEEKCKHLFGAEKFNYLAAMMKDNFVHFHAFPRYSSQKNLYGVIWEDADWPRPVTPAGNVPSADVVKAILADFHK